MSQFELITGDSLAWMRERPSSTVDTVFTSPPYEDARTYGIGFKRRGQDWVDWLAEYIVEAARISKGLVCVNVSSPKREGIYSGGVERLASDLIRWHGLVMPCSPYAWVKTSGIPGSGGQQFHRRDWEPVYAFCLPDKLPLFWSDNLAFGHPPKWAPGGEMSHRITDGKRVNQWGGGSAGAKTRQKSGKRQKSGRPSHNVHTMHERNGEVREQDYQPPVIANAGNVIKTHVGGGQDGSDREGHKNEAPMPIALAERFVCWFCPPGGVILDPFMGSGTTGVAAIKHGRKFIGIDVRPEMVELASTRLTETQPELFTDRVSLKDTQEGEAE